MLLRKMRDKSRRNTTESFDILVVLLLSHCCRTHTSRKDACASVLRHIRSCVIMMQMETQPFTTGSKEQTGGELPEPNRGE